MLDYCIPEPTEDFDIEILLGEITVNRCAENDQTKQRWKNALVGPPLTATNHNISASSNHSFYILPKFVKNV